MLARRARFVLSSFAFPAALTCAAVPAATAGEVSPTAEQLANLLAAGIDKDLVAEEGQCGDTATLDEYLAAATGEFAVVKSVFEPGTGGVQHTTRTALRAEREGLGQSPFLAFSLFGPPQAQSGALGVTGFRVHTLAAPGAGYPRADSYHDWMSGRGESYGSVMGAPAAGSGVARETQTMTLGEFKARH